MLVPPLAHQTAALAAATSLHPTAPVIFVQLPGAVFQTRIRTNFCFFMEQGTGKSYTALYEFEQLWQAGVVDAMVVVAPNGVHKAWLEIEVPKLLGPACTFLWTSAATKKRDAAFTQFLSSATALPAVPRIAAFNCEAFSHTQSEAEWHLKEILRKYRCYLIFDESQTLKTPSAKRSKNLARLGKQAVFRRLATGTHIAESPLDVYAQFRALDKELLGFGDFATFKAHFAVWYERKVGPVRPDGTQRSFQDIARWQHLDQLKSLIDAHAFLITKAQCLELPPKTHLTRFTELPPAVRRIYDAAKAQAIVELDAEGSRLTMRFAFTKLLRLAQIAGGFILPDGATAPQPIGGIEHNVKLLHVLQIIDELPKAVKVIIWCRFRHEAAVVAHRLNDEQGEFGFAALVHGAVPPETRAERVLKFSTDPAYRFLVGTTAVGGRGFNLTCATHMIYFSNNFSLEQRLQSEDRIHRYGQRVPVTYHDLVAPNTVDELTQRMVTEKRTIADLFKGDVRALRDWLVTQ